MDDLFRLSNSCPDDPEVRAWFNLRDDEVRALAKPWFDTLRACGPDVWECLHDGHPTACVEGVAFAYVNAFRHHANVGFFHGAALDDPKGLLEGSGKRMRHVKVRWGTPVDGAALKALIQAAYADIGARLANPN